MTMAASSFGRALVVGGTSGIGRSMALRIANASPEAHVTIASRSVDKAATEIHEEKLARHDNIAYAKVDCTSVRDIKRFTAGLIASNTGKPFDILVISPGILSLAGFTPTEDGLDRKFVLHYYSRMLVIRDLIQANCLTSDAVVMSVLDGWSSDPNRYRNAPFPDDDEASLTKPGSFSIKKCAAHATAFTDLQLSTFGGQPGSEQRIFIHAYPGIVKTPLAGGLPLWARVGTALVSALLGRQVDACATNMFRGIEAVQKAKASDEQKRSAFNIDASGKILAEKVKDLVEAKTRCDMHTWTMLDRAGNDRH